LKADRYQEVVKWRIDIIVPGPNSRYNAAKVTFHSVNWLAGAFERAQQKMQTLEKQSISGEYANIIETCEDAKVEVKATGGSIRLLFWASSGTFMFARFLTLGDVENAITILADAPSRAEQMVATLKELIQH
jgi:hypothetical protein